MSCDTYAFKKLIVKIKAILKKKQPEGAALHISTS